MSTLEHGVGVARDPEEVWGVVGDFDKDERWRSVERMCSDPVGPARAGTRTHEVLSFLGSTYVTEATVTSVGPGRRLAYEGGGDGTTVRGYRRVEETPGGTRFVEGLEIKRPGRCGSSNRCSRACTRAGCARRYTPSRPYSRSEVHRAARRQA